MKFLVATLLVVGCVSALPAPAPAPVLSITTIGGSIPVQWGQFGGGESQDVQGLDYNGHQVAKDVGDTINSAMDNLDAQNAGASDLEATVNNLATVVKEPLGWAAGTVGGLANGAVGGVTGALKGLESGGIGGALRGLTGGVAKGTAKGFSNILGSVLGSSGTV